MNTTSRKKRLWADPRVKCSTHVQHVSSAHMHVTGLQLLHMLNAVQTTHMATKIAKQPPKTHATSAFFTAGLAESRTPMVCSLDWVVDSQVLR